MEPEINQTELTPEEAKAALGNATFLQDQLLSQMNQMPEAPQEAPVEPQTAPTEELDMEIEDEGKQEMDDLRSEFNAFKKDVNETIEKKLEEIKDLVKGALEDGEE